MVTITVAAHPLFDARAFLTSFPRPLGEMATPPAILGLLRADAAAPMQSDDGVREAVRRLLRHGGFKPAGRSKPASEYLLRAAADGSLGSINVAVDICNIVSLHSGLPISVVDLAKAQAPFRIAVAPPGSSYVFNASGQTIDLAGLLCLEDAAGPCGNAVKDAQRTKTDAATTRTLTIIWGSNELGDRPRAAESWYRQLLAELGALTENVALATSASHRHHR
ncbi:MAG: phenylalanine--tRNA ligase beta subunit-related protein [Gemmataceae bacterium]|nr:phenylalanine--tRNA ligase beta subunit-related protein [Gemmataceae bacterium]